MPLQPARPAKVSKSAVKESAVVEPVALSEFPPTTHLPPGLFDAVEFVVSCIGRIALAGGAQGESACEEARAGVTVTVTS